MASTFIKLLGEIFKALDEAGKNPASKDERRPIRQIPIAVVNALLKENKKEEAIAFLQRSMNWDEAHARNFMEGLQPGIKPTAITAQRAQSNLSHSQTHIDKILSEYATAENNASENLFSYFFKLKR